MADFVRNRRKPDRIQISLVWLVSLAIGLIAYQILDNQQNAVSRSKVDTMIIQMDKMQSQMSVLQEQVNELVYESKQTRRSLDNLK